MKNIDLILGIIACNPEMLKISEEHYNYFSKLKPHLKQKGDAFLSSERLRKNNVGTYNYAAFFKIGEEYWAASCSHNSFTKSTYLKKQGLIVNSISKQIHNLHN